MRTTAIATVAILWFGGIAAVAPLYVASAGVTCHGGSAQAQYNPGVTFKKQTVQFQGNGYGEAMIDWNTGEKSVVTQTSFRAETFTTSIDGGHIEEGKFKGCSLRMVGRSTMSVVEMGAQCVTSGLTTYAWEVDE
ncbi:hypothetical protein BGX29_010720, partial [Mortierella sp. GBA35]